MSAKADRRKAQLREMIQKEGYFSISGQRRKLRRKARKLARRKTIELEVAKAQERERHAAEMAAFEQRQRYTLIKRSLREHWPDDRKENPTPLPRFAPHFARTVEELIKLKERKKGKKGEA